MEEYYYMSVDDSPVGPLTLEKLRSVPLQPHTMVWKTALPDWVTASKMLELQDMFDNANSGHRPPPFQRQEQHYGTGGAARGNPTFDSESKVYSRNFNVDQLSQEQVKIFSQHGFNNIISQTGIIILSIVTFGIFAIIFHGLKHDKLPKIQYDDFGTHIGIALIFVPFFNFYWFFVFWLRLVDRVNFQFKLRHLPLPINREFALVVCILSLIPYINILVGLILIPILAGKIQQAVNQLAEMKQQNF